MEKERFTKVGDRERGALPFDSRCVRPVPVSADAPLTVDRRGARAAAGLGEGAGWHAARPWSSHQTVRSVKDRRRSRLRQTVLAAP
jgi:hypothetical protein